MLVSVALGLILLVPVLIVVGLGAYGSSITAEATAEGQTGAKLTLLPTQGTPGSALTVEGQNWPPRAVITVYLARRAPESSTDSLRLKLGKIVASRNGTFRFEAVVPAALVGIHTSSVSFIAEATGEGDVLLASGSSPFAIERPANSVRLRVIDAETGAALADSSLQVLDSFGQRLLDGATGQDGTAVFTGLFAGRSSLSVRRLGYFRRRVDLALGETEQADLVIALQPAPVRRLYAPATLAAGDGRIKIMGIDRWTGLPFAEEFSVPPGLEPPRLDEPGTSFYFGYLLPFALDETWTEGTGSPVVPDQVWTMGRIQRLVMPDIFGPPSSVWIWHLGTTERGDVVYSIVTSSLDRSIARIFLVEPGGGSVIRQQSVASSDIPILSVDGSQLHLIHRMSGAHRTLNIETWEMQPQSATLPVPVMHAVGSALRDGEGFILTTTGTIYRIPLERGELIQELSSHAGSTWMTQSPDGRLILADPAHNELVVIDQPDSALYAQVELPQPADWVWTDPDGPFTYAAVYDAGELIVFLIDSATLQYAGTLKFPNLARQEGPG